MNISARKSLFLPIFVLTIFVPALNAEPGQDRVPTASKIVLMYTSRFSYVFLPIVSLGLASFTHINLKKQINTLPLAYTPLAIKNPDASLFKSIGSKLYDWSLECFNKLRRG